MLMITKVGGATLCHAESADAAFYEVVTIELWRVSIELIQNQHATRKMLRMQTGRIS